MERNIYINEVNSSATISVMASCEKKKIELPADYADLTKEEYAELESRFEEKFLPLHTVLKEWQDKLREVGFKGSVSKLDLIAATGSGVFIWEKVKIYKLKLSTGKVIQVVSPEELEGQKYNRRKGVRINIDRVMDVEQGQSIYNVIVRDISYCGVAFIEPMVEESQLDASKPFVLHLYDEGEDGERLVGIFRGKITNQQKIDSGILNGCEIAADHASELQKYIANKQIEELRGKKLRNYLN